MKPNKKMRAAIALGREMEKAKPKLKDKKCVACNGSGRYDSNGSPKCGACEGTGKEQP